MQLHKKQQHARNILDTDRIGPLLVKLAMPAFLGMFVQSFYNVINTIFMGQFVDELAIAGLSIVFPLQMIMYSVAMLMGMGGASLISRFIGSREEARAERTLGNGISTGLFLGLIFMLAILPFATYWLKLIGATDEVMPYARPYLIIIIAATVPNVFAMTLLTYVRAEGNTRVGMIAMMVGAVLSIILDIIFVPVLHWGIVGAGLATVIAQVFSLGYLLSYYLSGSSYLRIRLQNLKPDFSIIKPMLSIGVAGFLQTAAGSLSSILMINMVIRWGGDPALEAYGIVQRLSMFAGMPAIVMGQSLQPILGYNYGAKRFNLGLRALSRAALFGTGAVFVTTTILYLIPGPIISIFSPNRALIDLGIHVSRLFFLSMPLMGMIMVGQTIFQALGKAWPAFVTALVRPVVFLVPVLLLMSHLWRLDGVFLSVPTSDLLTFFLIAGLAAPVIYMLRKKAAVEKLETREAATAKVVTTI